MYILTYCLLWKRFPYFLLYSTLFSLPLSVALSYIFTICIIHSATLMWLPQKNFSESKCGNWRRQWLTWNLTLNKQWNWSSCIKLVVSASWTHGLIAQSVRMSKQNSVVMGSNPTQANFYSYFKESFSGEFIYLL